MAQGVPLKKAIVLLEKVETLSSGDLTNDFTMGSLRKEIETLKKSDAAKAFAISGELLFKMAEYDQARLEYSKSFQLDPYDKVASYNYATSLAYNGFVPEAYEAFKVALKNSKEPSRYEKITQLSMTNLLLNDAKKAIDELVKMKSDIENIGYDYSTISSIRDFFIKNNIQDDDVSILASEAWNCLVENKIHHHVTTSIALYPQDFIKFNIYLDINSDTIVDLNIELATKLSQLDLPNNVVENVSVGYIPLTE